MKAFYYLGGVRTMKIIATIDKVWEEIEKAILSLTTIAMSLMLVGNALSRYFLNKSWAFTEEVGKMGVIVLTFMGLGYAARKKMHIEMSGFFDLMPFKMQRIVGMGVHFISAIVLLYCAYLGLEYVQHLQKLGQVSTILRVPLSVTMFVVPLGFFLSGIRYFVDLFIGIKQKDSNLMHELEITEER